MKEFQEIQKEIEEIISSIPGESDIDNLEAEAEVTPTEKSLLAIIKLQSEQIKILQEKFNS